MSAEAWREIGGDFNRAGKSLGRVGSAWAKKHPILVLGGGALLAGIAAWRALRPAPVVVERPRGVRKLGAFAWRFVRLGSLGLARAFSFASKPKMQPDSCERAGASPSNGRSQG